MQYDLDMISKHKDLFLEARGILLSYDTIIETKKERITTYSNGNGGICHMRTMPYGVDFGFLKGAVMTDDFKRLTGKGKLLRVLKMKSMDKELIKYYLDQALIINSKNK
jgi:hypothetical protein